jgi:hypothetical protein
MAKHHTFRSHLEDCKDYHCDDPTKCIFNLPSCRVCNGYDGCLTTECPGEKITKGFASAIKDARLDYTVEKGWHFRYIQLTQEQMEELVVPLRQV